jgi:hypothetical protein
MNAEKKTEPAAAPDRVGLEAAAPGVEGGGGNALPLAEVGDGQAACPEAVKALLPALAGGRIRAAAGFLRELDRDGMDSCYWAAGEWWGDYPLSLQPRKDFTEPAPQLALLTR